MEWHKIIADDQRHRGHIVCPTTASHRVVRIREHDAFACRNCDVWLEPLCGGTECDFCGTRPVQPNAVVTSDPAFTRDEARDLDALALSIWLPVTQALRAATVLWAARGQFAQNEDLFATNPANTLAYAAMNALEERSVVELSETLQTQTRLYDLSTGIRRRADLLRHRHVLSHPSAWKWTQPRMQKFWDDDRHITDIRAALVWDTQRGINDRLTELGIAPRLAKIGVTLEMAAALHSIYRFSAKDQGSVPSVDDLAVRLPEFGERFIAFLEKRPDGRLQPP